jgi:hypothetical protein
MRYRISDPKTKWVADLIVSPKSGSDETVDSKWISVCASATASKQGRKAFGVKSLDCVFISLKPDSRAAGHAIMMGHIILQHTCSRTPPDPQEIL